MKASDSGAYLPIATFEGVTLTQQQRDALADRIEKVILDRRRQAAELKRQARLRQMHSLEHTSDRHPDTPAFAQ